MALYQATRNGELRDMRVIDVAARGGAFSAKALAPEHHDRVRELAVEYLVGHDGSAALGSLAPAVPDAADVRLLLEIMSGESLPDDEVAFRLEELAFEAFPRAVEWSDPDSVRVPPGFLAVIVGAGFSGVAMAIQLERLGIPYRVLERQSDIGGTWSWNRYPGARVDTTSFIYQFTFEKEHQWNEYFATQREVQEYVREVARKNGVLPHVEFNTTMTRAVFDDQAAEWVLTARKQGSGAEETVHASVVIAASGLFSTAKELTLPGVAGFKGEVFHTTTLPSDFDARGRRIAFLGNGSTGVQLMPEIAPDADRLYAFVRTPQWIGPMERYKEHVSDETKWLLRNFPFYWNWYRYERILASLNATRLQEIDREWQRNGGAVSELNDKFKDILTTYMSEQLGHDTAYIKRLTPDCPPYARRMIVDNGWYAALLRPNVELVTGGVAGLSADGVITSDGRSIPVDTVIAASGFDVERYLWPSEYLGRNGQSIEKLWNDEGPHAFLGMLVPGFPNMFIMYGPGSQPRAGSLQSSIEQWVRYSTRAIIAMIESKSRTVEVDEDTCSAYNARMDEAMTDLVWTVPGVGERNYYVGRNGRQFVNAPWTNTEYHRYFAQDPKADLTFLPSPR
jgi:4-hydroxyacetophenone monooxygenase